MSFEDLGFSKIDIDREARTGAPEVIYRMGKTPDQAVAISPESPQTMAEHWSPERMRDWPKRS